MSSTPWQKRFRRLFAANYALAHGSGNRRLNLEWLEAREVLAPLLVTNVNDSGLGSFRQALLDANAASGPDTIHFLIGTGAQTIAPLSPLPSVTDSVTIDATTQPGFAGKPLIELNGAGASGGDGLDVFAPTTVRGLVVNRFTGYGVILSSGSNGSLIAGNYIGTNAAGTAAAANSQIGIYVTGASSNDTIGGVNTVDRNVISGNTRDGIYIGDSAVDGTYVLGNYLGVDAASASTIGNGSSGVVVNGGPTNTHLGGTAAGAGNVISGNSLGVFLGSSSYTTVQGNFIGTDAAGSAALPNQSVGIYFGGAATANVIGGTTAAARNVISGNLQEGILFNPGNVSSLVEGNYIGINAAGTAALGNGGAGISVNGDSSDTIGGSAAGAGNVISGNGFSGLHSGIDGISSSNLVIQGNYLGTNAAGTAAVPNADHGIALFNGASGTLIGGTSAGAGNLISGNSGYGIEMYADAPNTTIQGNRIGVNFSVTAALPNFGHGIHISQASDGGTTNTLIGGAAAGAGNIISGNGGNGIFISDTGNNFTVIQGNVIGTNAAGTLNLGNGGAGVLIANGAGSDTIHGNTVAFNSKGVVVTDSTTGVLVSGNSIYGNVGLGLDLGNDGATANDTGDADAGPNNLQNSPQTSYARIDAGGDLLVDYFVDSTSSNSTYPLLVELFKADASGQGKAYLGADNFTTADNANGGKVVNLGSASALGLNAGDKLVLTATDANGNTSEFSAPVRVADSIEVTNASDSGPGSLRQAILDADSDLSGTNTITFTMSGAQTIKLAAALPMITERVFIDGNSEGGFSGAPLIAIDTQFAGSDGLVLLSGNSTIRGLALLGNTSVQTTGIFILSNNNRIVGNYIGLDLSGTIGQGFSFPGVYITGGASNNVIGGLTAAERNVISAGGDTGVYIGDAANNTNNVIEGNYIGTNAAGTAAIGNSRAGILLNGQAVNTTIVNNVISGNAQGIFVLNSQGTLIQGNYIGVNAAGTGALANNSQGIFFAGGTGNDTIGGTTAAQRNIISANTADGILVQGSTSPLIIQGNYIGLDATGTVTLGNTGDGILVQNGSTNVLIGGTALGAGNTIEGNAKAIVIAGAGTSGITVSANTITNNLGLGIDLGDDGFTPNDAGDSDGGPNNLQNSPVTPYARLDSAGDLLLEYFVDTNSANAVYPLHVEFFKADGSGQGKSYLSADNFTTADFVNGGKTLNFGNAAALGVSLNDHLVLTATDAAGNTSEFSQPLLVESTIDVTNTNDSGTGSLRQAILDANSTPGMDNIVFRMSGPQTIAPLTPLPSITDAVSLDATTEQGFSSAPLIELSGVNLNGTGTGIGFDVSAGNSTIRGFAINRFDTAIRLQGGGSNSIEDDYLGTDLSGLTALGNKYGILLLNSAFNSIGSFGGNVISGNTLAGIELQGSGTTGTFIVNNLIGVGADFTTPLGNQQQGIDLFSDGGGETIGGEGGEGGGGNVIAHNGGAGVRVFSSGNQLIANNIYANGGPGILLVGTGNNQQQAPALYNLSGTTVTGALHGAPSTDFLLQFFASPLAGPAQQGQDFLGEMTATIDAQGNASFTFMADAIPAGEIVSATATNQSTFDTSAFSAGPPVTVSPAQPVAQSGIVNTAFANPLTFTLTDAYGQPTFGIPVVFTAPTTSGASGTFPGGVSTVMVLTDANGVASTVFTANTVAGTYVVNAAITGLSSTVQFALTNTPAAAKTFSVTPFPDTIAGTAQNFTVTALDAFGNLATGYRGTATFSSSDTRAFLPTPYTFTAADNGVHTFTAALITTGSQSLTVADGAIQNTQSNIAITAGTAARFTISAPAAVDQSSPFALTFRALDPFDNFANSYNGTVVLTADDPAAMLSNSFTLKSGTLTVANAAALQTVGTRTLTVTDSVLGIRGSTTLTVNNITPSQLVLTPSTPALNEGDTLTLSGTFSDPGIGDVHTIFINWGDGKPATTLTLPGGVFSFQTTHVYDEGSLVASPTLTALIQASVSDASASTFASSQVAVANVAPIVNLPLLTVVNVGAPLFANGSFSDPGMETFAGLVDYGDGSGPQALPLNLDRTFTLQHDYAKEGSYAVTVSINDGHTGIGVASLLANVVLIGVNVPGVDVAVADARGFATASTAGVTATLRTTPGRQSFILVSDVPPPVTSTLLGGTQHTQNKQLTASYDVRAINVGSEATATVTFRYIGEKPVLEFFENGVLKPVRGSRSLPGVSYVIDAANHTITVLFDNTSSPAITELRGTVFTISVQSAPQAQQVPIFQAESPTLVQANVPNSLIASDAPAALVVGSDAAAAPSITSGVGASEEADAGGGGQVSPLHYLPAAPQVPVQQSTAVLSPSLPDLIGPADDSGDQPLPDDKKLPDKQMPDEEPKPDPDKKPEPMTMVPAVLPVASDYVVLADEPYAGAWAPEAVSRDVWSESQALLADEEAPDESHTALDLAFATGVFLTPYAASIGDAVRDEKREAATV